MRTPSTPSPLKTPTLALPVDALRADFEAAIAVGPVVLSSPTGSGKSTRVPGWLADRGAVLVVEPRRVACRSLAARVADEGGVRLGAEVGYRVREEDRSGPETRVLFATPGVVLRMLAADGLVNYAAVVLDEFHERSLDTDLLLALLQGRFSGALVVMSATLDGDKVAAGLGGRHLSASGRLHPVEISYQSSGDATLPHADDLPGRVAAALRGLGEGNPQAPDVLVFLPGKAEIGACADALSRHADLGRRFEVVPLHGDLSLADQSRAFASSSRRKVVLSTNVAETSLTIPGIGAVVDAGLVRRTRYAGGRGFLTRMPVALDSADQRAGRAGRLGPGVAIRLWSARARLDADTPPEIHRESLVPLLMGAAACGVRVDALAWIDPPRDHAVAAARAELQDLGALDAQDALTAVGRALFGLPLDAALGRLLVEARAAEPGVKSAVVDLVAALAVGRPLFARGPGAFDPTRAHPDDDLGGGGCDVTALVRAVRHGDPQRHGLRPGPLQEARNTARRLRGALGCGALSPTEALPERRALARVLLQADPRLAHIARRRRGDVAWSNGGTEVSLARESALARLLDTPEGANIEAALILEIRGLGLDARRTQLLGTCAMPAPIPWLAEAGVGREQVADVRVIKGKRVVARLERVHAKRVLGEREVVPEGDAAREAIAKAFLDGRLWRDTLLATTDRLEARALWARVEPEGAAEAPLPLAEWVPARVAELGVESGEDLAMLSPQDLLAEDLDAASRAQLDRRWPRHIDLADAKYTVRYELASRTVVVEQVAGGRKEPPPLSWLPAFAGFAIDFKHRNVQRTLRPRR